MNEKYDEKYDHEITTQPYDDDYDNYDNYDDYDDYDNYDNEQYSYDLLVSISACGEKFCIDSLGGITTCWFPY